MHSYNKTQHLIARTIASLFLLLTISAAPSQAEPPAGYYDTVDPSTSETLRLTIHQVIDNHTKIPYTSSSTDTWNVLELADEDPYDSGKILDIYQNRTFSKHGAGNNDYNREHTWPKSYGFPDDGSSNKPYSDCHHLFLCDITYNGDRDNRVYDNCLSSCISRVADDYDGQSGTNLTKNGSPMGIWETWIGRRGDCARAMFYMDVRYEGDGSEPDLILTDDKNLIDNSATGNNESIAYMGLLETLISWHLEDPVDDKERERNDWVHFYQGNRNPFIDHPEWVLGIFDPLASVADQIPYEAEVKLNYISGIAPNPFSPSTMISFNIEQAGPVSVELFTIEGKLIRLLKQESNQTSNFQLSWDGTDEAGRQMGTGSYFCRLKAGEYTDTGILLRLK